MNDLTYVGTLIARQREADLVHQLELLRSHRERGQAPAPRAGRPLTAWFRTLLRPRAQRTAIAGP